MKKESLSIIAVKTLLTVIIFTGLGTIIIGGGYLIGEYCKNQDNQFIKPPTQEVIITTDKTEYEQEEIIKTTIRNNLDNSIWYRDDIYCYLEFNSGNTWGPSLIINMMVCPRGEIKELDSNREISYDIDFSNNDHIFYSGAGKYRISFKYNYSLENVGGRVSYSDEFTIKEKIKDDTADWQTYRNEEYGFEVKYPSGFTFKSTGPNISQEALNKGEQIAGSIAPSFDTIIFSGKNNGGEEKFYIDIFHPDERNISEKNYDDYMNVSGPCDTRWDFGPLVKKMEKINNIDVLKVAGKTSRDSQIISFIGCNYFKNQDNNLIVLNTASNSEKDFNETNAILQKVLSTLVLGNTANTAQESEIAFLQSNNIWILNKDFKNRFKIVSGDETITKFSFSPDGKEIYWLNGKEIWKKDSNERIKLLIKAGEINIEAIKKRWEGIDWVNPNEIDKLKGGIENFELSPDGKYIAYEEIEDYTGCCMAQPNIPVTRIWIMKADGSENIKIDTPSGVDRPLMVFDKWFPDSRKILYHFRAGDEAMQGSPFFEIGVDGKNSKMYTAIYQDKIPDIRGIAVVGADPIFSPDGTKMVYIEDWERVYLANIDGKDEKMVLQVDTEKVFLMNNASDIIKWSESGNSFSITDVINNKTFIFDKEGEIIFESE